MCILEVSGKEMAPRVLATPRDPAHRKRGTHCGHNQYTRETPEVPADELLTAACEAMRLLQDRQAHTPQEMLDPREIRVLRSLRTAIRRCSS